MRENRPSQAIDLNRLEGRDRTRFEKGLLHDPRLHKGHRSVLRVMLDEFFCGKADCYPSVRRIFEESGYPEGTIRRYLAELVAHGIIVRVIDRSIWRQQRRFILASHPNAQAILDDLRANPNVEFLVPEAPRKVAKKPRQEGLVSVGDGLSLSIGDG